MGVFAPEDINRYSRKICISKSFEADTYIGVLDYKEDSEEIFVLAFQS